MFENNFIESYNWTTIFSVLMFIFLISISIGIEIIITKKNQNYKLIKKFSTKKITYVSALISIIVIANVITIWMSNIFLPKTIEYRLGDVIELLPGMLFGPVLGILSGTIADSIGILFSGTGGAYHFGFTFEASFTGFIGGLIVFFGKKNWWWAIIVLFTIDLILQQFFLTPIYLIAIGYHVISTKKPYLVYIYTETILLLIKLPIYLTFYFLLFRVSYQFLNKSFDKNIWANIFGEIKFLLNRNLKEKFKKLINKKNHKNITSI